MAVSTGLVVTRQGAITGQKGCGKSGSLGKKEGEERHEVLQNHHNMLFKKYRSMEATLPLNITSIYLNFTKNTF